MTRSCECTEKAVVGSRKGVDIQFEKEKNKYTKLYSVYLQTKALNNTLQHNSYNTIHNKYRPYIFRHWSAIFRKSTNTEYYKSNAPLQVLMALTVYSMYSSILTF
jgi:hypothetical protein